MARFCTIKIDDFRILSIGTNLAKNDKQNKTKQNKTKQKKTKQNKTKQNKTKQNKTKQIRQHLSAIKRHPLTPNDRLPVTW